MADTSQQIEKPYWRRSEMLWDVLQLGLIFVVMVNAFDGKNLPDQPAPPDNHYYYTVADGTVMEVSAQKCVQNAQSNTPIWHQFHGNNPFDSKSQSLTQVTASACMAAFKSAIQQSELYPIPRTSADNAFRTIPAAVGQWHPRVLLNQNDSGTTMTSYAVINKEFLEITFPIDKCTSVPSLAAVQISSQHKLDNVTLTQIVKAACLNMSDPPRNGLQ